MESDKNIMPVSQKFIGDVRRIIEDGRKQAYAAAGNIALATFGNIDRKIVKEEQNGNSRAEYGKRLIAELSDVTNKSISGNIKKFATMPRNLLPIPI